MSLVPSLRRSVLTKALMVIAAGGAWSEVQGQESKSIMILTSAGVSVPPAFDEPQAIELADAAAEGSIEQEVAIQEGSEETETIRERFPDGRVRIERQVALDAEGNYVNHGNYQEWTAKGDLVSTGAYEMGMRTGPWIKICQSKESKLYESYPYSKFKAPFHSTVEFSAGKMNGVWTITDADNRMISQIQLVDGTRDGQSTWFHPNGQILYQADYKQGILSGIYLEKTAEGKVAREEKYTEGRRLEIERENYSSKTMKSEVQFLSAPQVQLSSDDWSTSTLASYSSGKETTKHGPYQNFYENGQLKSKGTYDQGLMTGSFESWFANGQKAVTGSYAKGEQAGKWTWWHPNGMRRAVANYDQGKLAGELMAWNEAGKRVTDPTSLSEMFAGETPKGKPVGTSSLKSR